MGLNLDHEVSIIPVESKEDLSATVALFETYAQSLGIDLSYQDFSTEMATMPGKYAPPAGALFLARDSASNPIGCVGLRPLQEAGDGCCEMKRLYVDPKGRGLGVGRKLAEAVINEAKRLGHQAILLDSLDTMFAAQKLYKSLGFVNVEGYYETPIEANIFMRLDLTS